MSSINFLPVKDGKLSSSMKRSILIALLVLPLFKINQINAAAVTPSLGQWEFCTSETDIGCIESFKTKNDTNQEVTIVSQSQKQTYTGLSFDISCSSFSTNQSSCDSKASTPSDSRGVGKCGFTEPAKLVGTASWPEHVGQEFQMTVRTGDFDPVFSYGNGITGTNRIENSDGTYKFVWQGKFDEIKTSSIPSSLTSGPLAANHEQLMKDFFSTATVNSAVFNSTIRIMPAAYLRVLLPIEKVNGVWLQDCKDLPMKGLWVEANAQMFSYQVGFFGKSTSAASKFIFAASSPHYLPGGTDLNPARFNMFIPDSYVASIGYTTESFNVSALKLSVADNQVAKPVLTRRSGGFGLDFGIAHYSTPNPVLEFLNPNWTETADSALTSNTTAPTTTTTTTAVYVPPVTTIKQTGIQTKVKKTISGTSLAKSVSLSIPKKAKISITMASKYAKKCKVSGTSVKTLAKGTCVVKVTVTTSTKKKTSKNVTITVS